MRESKRDSRSKRSAGLGSPRYTSASDMDGDTSTTVIAQGAFLELREYQNAFREAGLEAQIMRPPAEHCSS
jgi:hypothetical protein